VLLWKGENYISIESDAVYRVSQEECARLREVVPYVNPSRAELNLAKILEI
jgi:hypothetical protein